MTDFYKLKLKHAAWTWLEGKFSRPRGRPDRKDRVSSRNDKRAARNDERKEIEHAMVSDSECRLCGAVFHPARDHQCAGTLRAAWLEHLGNCAKCQAGAMTAVRVAHTDKPATRMFRCDEGDKIFAALEVAVDALGQE